MDNEVKVNDGGGLYDNIGLIDSMIVDCNALVKDLFDGQFIRFCSRLSGIGQKLLNLKEGVQHDTESLRKEINDLRRFIKDINAAESGAEDVQG